MCCAWSLSLTPSLSSFALLSLVLSLFAMPKVGLGTRWAWLSMPSWKQSWATTPQRTDQGHHCAPCPPPMVPSATTRMMKKRKKAAAPAAPAAASNNQLTAMTTLSTASATKKGKWCQAHWHLCGDDVGKYHWRRKSSRCGNHPWAEVGCQQRCNHQWWHCQQALVQLPVAPERAIWQENCAGQPGLCWHVVGEDAANNDTGRRQQNGLGTTNKKQQPTIDGSGAMMEDVEASDRWQKRAEGNGVDKGQQTTTNQ